VAGYSTGAHQLRTRCNNSPAVKVELAKLVTGEGVPLSPFRSRKILPPHLVTPRIGLSEHFLGAFVVSS